MRSFTFPVSLLAAASIADALSSCILSCQSTSASESGCSSDYNNTLCYCSSDFATNTKACLYENDCSDDLDAFYDNVDSFCDGDEESSSAPQDTSSTVSENDGALGSCVLNCQASAGQQACSTTNYNTTSCYCDTDDFALDVKACLYQNCSDYVSVFYNYRSGICGTQSSSEYRSSQAAADSTPSATSASTAQTTSASVASAATSALVSDSSASGGLSAGALAGISVGSIVGGLLVFGAILYAVLRKRKAGAAAVMDAEFGQANGKQMKETSSIGSRASTLHAKAWLS
ncbi:hypothetical protein KC331_g8720 [Hortaea werneckii]|nr:hypothetical protein KC331_g8720 [Hortaea werneckii]KAI7712538.1 hypothetical protein KC353_g8191 [Hortaea werneckii]